MKTIAIITKKLASDKYRITVLLWNSLLTKTVNNRDYGNNGLGFTVNNGYVIEKFTKLNKIRWAKKFDFIKQPCIAENIMNLHMGDLIPGSFVEFGFEVRKTEKDDCTKTIIPHNVGDSLHDEPPIVDLNYEHSNLNIRELRYKATTQILQWFCIVAAILTIMEAITTTVLRGYSPEVIVAGIMLLACWATIFVIAGDFVPPFVTKHMKNKGYIKTCNRSKKDKIC